MIAPIKTKLLVNTKRGEGHCMVLFLFLFLWTGKLKGIFSSALQEPTGSEVVISFFLDLAADFFEMEQPSALKWSTNLGTHTWMCSQ